MGFRFQMSGVRCQNSFKTGAGALELTDALNFFPVIRRRSNTCKDNNSPDAKNAERAYFSLAVDPVEGHGTGTPAREKTHFILDVAIIMDIKQFDMIHILSRIVNIFRDSKAMRKFFLSVLPTERKKIFLCVLCVCGELIRPSKGGS